MAVSVVGWRIDKWLLHNSCTGSLRHQLQVNRSGQSKWMRDISACLSAEEIRGFR